MSDGGPEKGLGAEAWGEVAEGLGQELRNPAYQLYCFLAQLAGWLIGFFAATSL